MSQNTKQNITPFFEIDLEKIRYNYASVHNLLSEGNVDCIVAYAVKANYDEWILKTLKDSNAYFEICSPNEMALLKKCGVDEKKVIVNGCFSDYDFVNEKIQLGSIFFIDSVNQIDYLSENVNVGIRINFDFWKKDDIHYNKKTSRFGVPLDGLAYCLAKLNKRKIRIVALNFHSSGNDRSPEVYGKKLLIARNIIDSLTLEHLRYIDLGGGFKIDEKFWAFEDYASEIKRSLKKLDLMKYGIMLELGNCIVRTACTYKTTVVSEKKIGECKIINVDGSALHLGIPNSYKVCMSVDKREKIKKQLIVGNSCKESDILTVLDDYPEIKKGDEISFEDVGAYTMDNCQDYIVARPNKVYKKSI